MALYPQVTKQKELYQKVYPGHEMLGWYSVGAEVGAPLGVCAAVGGVDLFNARCGELSCDGARGCKCSVVRGATSQRYHNHYVPLRRK
jgi:hypothetical protein